MPAKIVVREIPVALATQLMPPQANSLASADCPLPPHPFVHNNSKGLELSPNPFDRSCIVHAADVPITAKISKAKLTSLFLRGS